jgi:fermentation-respiration switch protein FrsA (DUF1100 family)
LIAYLLLLVIMMFLEEKLIFFPAQYPIGEWRPYALEPVDAWFRAADGTELHGWFVAHPRPRGVVLFCHGNAGNITHRDHALRQLRDVVGVSVLIFDYRGYGRSRGSPDEPGLLADARAAANWLEQRTGLAPDQIILMGESLGCSVAVDLAADRGARALVLENAFPSAPDVGAYHYPWLPVRWLMRTRLDAAGKIGRFHGPLLQSHGDADTIVPIRFGRRLFEAANEPKQFLTLPGLDHNDLRDRAYYETLRQFVEGLP